MPVAPPHSRFRLRITLVHIRPLTVLIATFLFTLPLIGCGDVSHGDRVPLTGTVKKGGELLLEKATIYFEPLPNEGGIGASGQLTEGSFSIPEEAGLTPGHKYTVIVQTAPGIPPENTPRDQIKLPQRFETTVEIPPRDQEDSPELEIVLD